MYTFRSIRDQIIPKSLKCSNSVTKFTASVHDGRVYAWFKITRASEFNLGFYRSGLNV